MLLPGMAKGRTQSPSSPTLLSIALSMFTLTSVRFEPWGSG